MKPAILTSDDTHGHNTPPAARTIFVACSDGLHPTAVFVTRGLLDSGVLTAVAEPVIERPLGESRTGQRRLSVANPALNERERAALAPAGLVAEGAVVEADQVLGSVVVEARPGVALHQLPGDHAKDDSVRTPEETLRLAYDAGTGESPSCVVHRPLSRRAREEAERLLSGRLEPAEDGSAPQGGGGESPSCWLEEPTIDGAMRALVRAAASGVPVRLDGPHGLLAGGAGPS